MSAICTWYLLRLLPVAAAITPQCRTVSPRRRLQAQALPAPALLLASELVAPAVASRSAPSPAFLPQASASSTWSARAFPVCLATWAMTCSTNSAADCLSRGLFPPTASLPLLASLVPPPATEPAARCPAALRSSPQRARCHRRVVAAPMPAPPAPIHMVAVVLAADAASHQQLTAKLVA